jgi:hypothetical protein
MRVRILHVPEAPRERHQLTLFDRNVSPGVHRGRDILNLDAREVAAGRAAGLVDAEFVLGDVEAARRVGVSFILEVDGGAAVARNPLEAGRGVRVASRECEGAGGGGRV